MKYIKLFESGITFTPDKLGELVNQYAEIRNNAKAYVEKYASMILSVSIKDIYADIQTYKDLIKKLEDGKSLLEETQGKIEKIVDMYPMLPSERPAGTHELISNLEYKISRDLADYYTEVYELVEIVDRLIYIAEHQENHEIISEKLK